eukprot:TRINITY_DN115072_c0_g1_i1.p1 TRINITY_DN115072_c0_g1~~TRINITY_DN115072_c0_g1_i1.p1  ORF type:complete len:199 (-),score=37.45 TRINITY_DN115072_c0_g1_i1:49-645(-)
MQEQALDVPSERQACDADVVRQLELAVRQLTAQCEESKRACSDAQKANAAAQRASEASQALASLCLKKLAALTGKDLEFDFEDAQAAAERDPKTTTEGTAMEMSEETHKSTAVANAQSSSSIRLDHSSGLDLNNDGVIEGWEVDAAEKKSVLTTQGGDALAGGLDRSCCRAIVNGLHGVLYGRTTIKINPHLKGRVGG